MEVLFAERGLDISHESVRRWFLKFGVPIAGNLRRVRPTPSGCWQLDEMVIVTVTRITSGELLKRLCQTNSKRVG